MPTFTIREGVHSCDHCGLRVGKGWRALSAHTCPRPRTWTPPPKPTCQHCGTPLTRRDNETARDYRARLHCSRSCAASTANLNRRAS